MTKITPQTISDIQGVAKYWRQCLAELDAGHDDQQVASHMVGVVASQHEQSWSIGTGSHPAYPIIFELAASLELPGGFTDQRAERWECIKALVLVLERKYLRF